MNAEELKKFASIGQKWWDTDSKAGTGPLHFMNPTRVEFIRTVVSSTDGKRRSLPPPDQLRGLKILDVGCGGGILSESLARLGANVTAIDPTVENITVAKCHASKFSEISSRISYKAMTIEEMARSGETFDVVCSLEVVEHVNTPLNFISLCKECLKEDNGSLVMSTINRTAKSYLIAILGAEYITRMVPFGTHDWHKFLTPSELSRLITTSLPNSSGGKMIITSTKGLVPRLDIFSNNIKWELSNCDFDVNYILHAVKVKR